MGTLAITGGEPVRTQPWPSWPFATEKGIEAAVEVLRTDRWSRGRGTEARNFEKRFPEYLGAAHGLAVSSGTAALEVGLRSLNLSRGAEVILSPYTFMASASAVLMARCVPIFADIHADTYNLDPAKIEAAITERTEAIMTVHFGGRPCDMGPILDIARRHNLKVIEDCSHAHGAKYDGKALGTLGDVGAFSLGPGKHLTGGEGGIVLTNNEELYWRAVDYHDLWSGSIRPRIGVFRYLSWNYRISEVVAALLSAQLDVLEEQVSRRSENGDYFAGILSDLPGITPRRHDPRITRDVYHIFIFRYDERAFDGLPRERFVQAIRAEGVPASIGYKIDCRQQPLFQEPDVDLRNVWPREGPVDVDYRAMSCPTSERLCLEETVWVDQSAFLLGRSDVDQLVEAIEKVRKNVGELTIGEAAATRA